MKKGQMSIFIIIGILAVVLVAFFMFSSNKEAVDVVKDEKEVLEFSAFSREGINSFVKKCMMDSLVLGITEYGIPNSGSGALRDFVLEKTLVCLDEFNAFKDQDFELTKNTPIATIEVDEESTRYKLFYPLTFNRGGTELGFEEFIVDFPNMVSSSDFENGVAKNDIYLNTPDSKASLFIPKGTKVTDESGNALEFISLKAVDKRANGLRNSFVVGSLIYEGLPDGAQFSEPATFTMEYKDEDLINFLEEGMKEEDLKCTYLSDSGMHLPWPSEVDTEKNRLTCQIEHFTNNQITAGCGTLDQEESINHVDDIKIYRPACGIPNMDICTMDDFLLCSKAEDKDSHCNHLIKEKISSGPYDNAVYMKTYNPDVVQLQIGYTTYFGECKLSDWVYKDDAVNQCACEVYDWKDEADHTKGKEYRSCEPEEVTKCYSSCRDEVLLSDEINNGPVKVDGIADDDDELPEFSFDDPGSVWNKKYKKGCICLHDATVTTADLECTNVIPAPMTWGWETASGNWDYLSHVPTTSEDQAVDGIGVYTFEFLGKGDSCLIPESFSTKVDFEVGDKVSVYFDDVLVSDKDTKGRPEGSVTIASPDYVDEIKAFIDVQGTEVVQRERDISVVVSNAEYEDKPQCAYADASIEWIGSGVEIKSSPKDGICAVDIYSRIMFECNCPSSDADIQKCLDENACMRDIEESTDQATGYGTGICSEDLPSSCDEYVMVESGGYCDPDGNKVCLVNTNLEGSGECKCGSETYTSGAALCCGGELITADELPQGAPFTCESRSKVANTCTNSYADANWVCMETCPSGYNRITGAPDKGSPRCPIVNPDTGLADGYMECCERITGCTGGPSGKTFKTGESLIEGEFCYYCQQDGQMGVVGKDEPEATAYCPRPGKKGLPGDSCEFATCDVGLVCCEDGGKKICTAKEECSSYVTCGNGKVEGTETCDYDAISNPAADCETGTCVFSGSKECSGTSGGKLDCNTDCTVDDSMCTCGNGQLDEWETCDVDSSGLVLSHDGLNCEQRIGKGGKLKCTDECTKIDTSLCTCGNNVADNYNLFTNNVYWEDCDNNDLNGKTCKSETSSNGILSCKDDCRFDTSKCTCGDGTTQSWEKCDKGAANVDESDGECPYGQETCTLCSKSCTEFTAKGTYCGDGTRQRSNGEECDDGNKDNTDDCKNDCKSATCGDGITQGDEQCDDGTLNSDTLPDHCRTDCKDPTCGDEVVDSDEDCEAAGSGSSSDDQYGCTKCKWSGGWCGDGKKQTANSETCDPASSNLAYDMLCSNIDYNLYSGGTASCDSCKINTNSCELLGQCTDFNLELTSACTCGNEFAARGKYCCKTADVRDWRGVCDKGCGWGFCLP